MQYYDNRFHLQGFTLPELLAALAVTVILITSIGPSMQSLIADRRVAAVTSEMYQTLILARSEAIKRKTTISVCSSLNGSVCDQGNNGWQHGWLIFSDSDSDGILNDNNQLIRATPKQSPVLSIHWNRGFSLSFNSRGQTSTAGSFEICESSETRAIIISMTGRARVEERDVCS